MADGPPGIHRVFTRHGDNLDDLLRRKSGWRARAGVIGQGLRNQGGERFVTALLGFHLLQLGGEGTPPPAPHLYRPAIEVHLAHDVALVGSRLEGQKNLGASHQTLGAGLTAGQSAPSRPVGVRSAVPWGRRKETAQQRWSYEHPFGRTWPFLAHMIPYRCLYEYFCQAPLALPPLWGKVGMGEGVGHRRCSGMQPWAPPPRPQGEGD